MCFALLSNQTVSNCYYLCEGKCLVSTWYIAIRKQIHGLAKVQTGAQ